jgi:L,D-transpeptidase ErfK/SrfK
VVGARVVIGTLSWFWRRRGSSHALRPRCGVFAPALLVLAALSMMSAAAAAEFPLAPGQTYVGQLGHYTIRKGEVFGDIARRFDVGYTELVAANPGVDPWIPRVGTEITIPSLYILPVVPHQGIVINLGQYRLFYFPPDGERVLTYPLGLGVVGWGTPLGTTRIASKEPNPTWYPPASMRKVEPDLPLVVGPGPDNPLGAFALHLGWKNILLHGTDEPDGIGRNVSHGCMHLYPEDIAQLFKLVSVGTPVRAIDEPAAAAWAGDRLYLTVHPSPKQVQQIDLEQPVSPDPERDVRLLVQAVAGQYAGAVDWHAVDRAAAQRTNMPIVVADKSAYAAAAAQPTPPPPLPPAAGTEADFDREAAQAYARATAAAQQPQPDGDAARQYPYDNPATESAERAQQSFDRAMQSFERAEQLGDRDSQ